MEHGTRNWNIYSKPKHLQMESNGSNPIQWHLVLPCLALFCLVLSPIPNRIETHLVPNNVPIDTSTLYCWGTRVHRTLLCCAAYKAKHMGYDSQKWYIHHVEKITGPLKPRRASTTQYNTTQYCKYAITRDDSPSNHSIT